MTAAETLASVDSIDHGGPFFLPAEATAEVPVTIDAMMRHIFKKYDKDKSGFIDQAELKDVLRDLSIKFTEEQAASLYKSMDRNGTGQIEIEEVSFRID